MQSLAVVAERFGVWVQRDRAGRRGVRLRRQRAAPGRRRRPVRRAAHRLPRAQRGCLRQRPERCRRRGRDRRVCHRDVLRLPVADLAGRDGLRRHVAGRPRRRAGARRHPHLEPPRPGERPAGEVGEASHRLHAQPRRPLSSSSRPRPTCSSAGLRARRRRRRPAGRCHQAARRLAVPSRSHPAPARGAFGRDRHHYRSWRSCSPAGRSWSGGPASPAARPSSSRRGPCALAVKPREPVQPAGVLADHVPCAALLDARTMPGRLRRRRHADDQVGRRGVHAGHGDAELLGDGGVDAAGEDQVTATVVSPARSSAPSVKSVTPPSLRHTSSGRNRAHAPVLDSLTVQASRRSPGAAGTPCRWDDAPRLTASTFSICGY